MQRHDDAAGGTGAARRRGFLRKCDHQSRHRSFEMPKTKHTYCEANAGDCNQ